MGASNHEFTYTSRTNLFDPTSSVVNSENNTINITGIGTNFETGDAIFYEVDPSFSTTQALPVNLSFDPTTDVDLDSNTITIETLHGLETGDEITYEIGYLGETATEIGNLTKDTVYYAIRISETELKLATTKAEAEAYSDTNDTSINLDTGAVGTLHNLSTSRDVTVYDTPLQNLENSTYYHVVVIDDDTIQLVESLADTDNVQPIAIDGSVATGSAHTLSTPGTGSGISITTNLKASDKAQSKGSNGSNPKIRDLLANPDLIPLTSSIFKPTDTKDLLKGKAGKDGVKKYEAIDGKSNLSFGLSFALNLFDHDVITTVGSSAILKSTGDITVDSKATQKVQTVVDSATGKDSSGLAIATSFALGFYDNTVQSLVYDGATLDASGNLAVTSNLEYPFLIDLPGLFSGTGDFDFSNSPLDAYGNLGILASDFLLGGKLGFNKLFNTFATTKNKGKKNTQLDVDKSIADNPNDSSKHKKKGEISGTFGLALSGAYNEYTNTSEAIIGYRDDSDTTVDGVAINQDSNYQTDTQSVLVDANTEIISLNASGIVHFDLSLDVGWKAFKKGDATEAFNIFGNRAKNGLGVSMMAETMNNTTTAKIRDGVQIHTGALAVDADPDRKKALAVKATENIFSLEIAQGGGDAETAGFTGSGIYLAQTSNTIAQVESGATITGGSMLVDADSNNTRVNVVGAVQQTDSFGMGASVAFNDITRNTKAIIGKDNDDSSQSLGSSNINISGDLELEATNTGNNWAFSLSGSNQSPETPAIAEAGRTFGINASANVAWNLVGNTAQAYINDSGTIITTDGNISLNAKNSTFIGAFSGSYAIGGGRQKTTNIGLIGAYSQNEISDTTQAFITNATVTGDDISLNADTEDAILIAGSGALAGSNSYSSSNFSGNLVGSYSDNDISNTVEAFLENATVDANGDLSLTADDTSKIYSIGGAIVATISTGGTTGNAAAGVGATVATNKISNTIRSYISNSQVNTDDTKTTSGNVTLTTTSNSDILAIGIAASASITSSTGNSFSLGLNGAVSSNTIKNSVGAFVTNDSEVNVKANPVATETSSLTISATDTSRIQAFSGGIGFSLAAGSSDSAAVSVGLSLAYNTINNDINAYIDDSVITSGNTIGLSATSDATILSAAFTGSVAASTTVSAAGTGNETKNEVTNTTQAYINNNANVDSTGAISLTATDSSDIETYSIGLAVGVAAGDDVAGAVSIGVSLAENTIKNTTQAYIDSANVDSSTGDISISASTTASTIYSNAIAVSLTAAFSKDVSVSLSGAGANATNIIGNTVQAYIANSTLDNVNNLNVNAQNNSSITSVVGSVAASLALGGSPSGVAVAGALGVALARNYIGYDPDDSSVDNVVSAYIDNSSITAAGDITVNAQSTETIDAVSFAGSVAISAAAGGLSAAGSGTEVTNVFSSSISAYMNETSATATGDIEVKATSDSKVEEATAVGAAISGSTGGAVSVAASIVDNDINNDIQAYISSTTSKNVGAGGSLTVAADAVQARLEDVTAVTASLAGGSGFALSGGGIDIDNTVNNNVVANAIGAVTLTGTNVNILASEDAYIEGDSVNVSASYSPGLGAAIGVSLVTNEIKSTIKAGTNINGEDNGTTSINSTDTLIHADSIAQIEKTLTAGVSASTGAAALGNRADADIATLVKANAEKASLISTGDIDIKATADNKARTSSNGGALGAIAVGAMIADITLGKGNDVDEVAATIGDGTTVSANTLNITATSTDDLQSESIAAGGGVIAASGAQSQVSNDLATLAQIGDSATIVVDTLSMKSTHEQDFDASADSYSIAALSGSGAGIDNEITSKANVSIGTNSSITASSNIIIDAINRLTKDNFKNNYNLRTASASLANISALASNTDIGTDSNGFEAVVDIGSGSQLTVIGSNASPGLLQIDALNEITVFDSAQLETVSGFGLNVAVVSVDSNTNAGVNLNGATLENQSGDVYLTTKTEFSNNPSANVAVVGGVTGANATATAITDTNNQISLDGATIKGSDVYLYTGRDSFATPNLLDSSVNVELLTASLASVAVPIANSTIRETNKIDVTGTSTIEALEDVNFVANEGLGGDERAQANASVANISLTPFATATIENTTVNSSNQVNIGDSASIQAGANSQSVVQIKPLVLNNTEQLSSDRLGTELTTAEKQNLGLNELIDWEYGELDLQNITFNISTGIVIQAVDGANTGGTAGNYYQYLPETGDASDVIILQSQDFSDTATWQDLGTTEPSDATIYTSDVTVNLATQLEDKFYVVKPKDLDTLTLSYVNVGTLLVEQWQKVVNWITNHAGEEEAIARYLVQKAEIEETLEELGIALPDEDTGELIVNKELDTLVFSLPNIYAAPGSIFIEADGVDASSFASLVGNQLLAASGAEITIENQSPFAMTVNEVVIRDNSRISVIDGDTTVLTPGNIYANNTALTSNTDADDKLISITQDAFAESAYDLGTLTLPSISQDLYIDADVTNESGDVFIENKEGSIDVIGEITGENVTIKAAKDFSLNSDDWVHTNRDPRQYIEYTDYRAAAKDPTSVEGQQYAANKVSSVDNTYAFGSAADVSDSSGTLEEAINTNESAILAQGDISVTARYLNINGRIQSGVDTIQVTIDDSFTATNTQSLVDDDGNILSGISFSGDVPIDGYFDPEEDDGNGAIVIDDITPSGGDITLAGKIFSTGNGEINAASGYASVDIDNNSIYKLILSEIDTTKKREGKITIIDTETLEKVEYVTSDDNITETTFLGTLIPATGDEISTIEYTATGSNTYSFGDTIEYQPEEGRQYVWTEGQEQTLVTVRKYEDSSLNLFGGNTGFEDALADDTSYKWETVTPRDEFPLLESESLIPDGTNTVPSYANDTAYTIEYELKDDTSIDLIKNTSLVRDISTNTVYKYIADNDDVQLYDPVNQVVVADFTDTNTWESQGVDTSNDFEDPDNNKFDSNYVNRTIDIDEWTTGGGWLRKKTQHRKVTITEGLKDFYTHTLKADYAININLTDGTNPPAITVDTTQDLYLQGDLKVPDINLFAGNLPTISLTSTNGSITSADTVAIYGVTPTIDAGDDAEDEVKFNVEGDREALNVTAGGDIQVTAISLDNTSSIMEIGTITSDSGNVILTAADGFKLESDSSLITGDQVQLYAKNTNIGTESQSIKIDSSIANNEDTGGISAQANGDIYIQEVDGDLRLPESIDLDLTTSIYSETGSIYLDAVNGAIVDTIYELFIPSIELDTATTAENLNLTQTTAESAVLNSVELEESQETTLYHTYWETFRNAEKDAVTNTLSITGIANNQISFSSAHGLEAGDKVTFNDSETGTNPVSTNLVNGVDYYVIIVDETTIQLADSRYNSAISRTTTPEEIAIESGTTFDNLSLQEYSYTTDTLSDLFLTTVTASIESAGNTITRSDGGSFVDDGFAIDQIVNVTDNSTGELIGAYTITAVNATTLEFAADSFTASVASITVSDATGDKYRETNTTYGTTTYDANFIYEISDAEVAERIAERTVSADSLEYPISPGLYSFLYPNEEYLESLGTTSTTVETANIIGNNITLTALGTNGEIGNVSEPVLIDLQNGYENIPTTQKALMSIATADDVLGVSYELYQYIGSNATGADLAAQDFSDTSLWQSITTDFITNTDRTIAQVNSVTTGQVVLVQFSATEYGRYEYLGASGDIDFAEEDFTDTTRWQSLAATYGTDADSTVTLTNGNLVDNKDNIEYLTIRLLDDVNVEASESVTADTSGAAGLQSIGDLPINHVNAGDDVYLTAGGAIIDSYTDAIAAVTTTGDLSLTSDVQVMGVDGFSPFRVNLSADSQVTAEVLGDISLIQVADDTDLSIERIEAEGEVFITTVDGNINLGKINTTGAVDLRAEGNILDAFADTLATVVNISTTDNVNLEADGDIGEEDNFIDLEINGELTAFAEGNIFINSTVALNVDSVEAESGNIILSVQDSLETGEDLILNAGGEIIAPDGTITLLVGDNIQTDTSSRIIAGGEIAIALDATNLDTGVGTETNLLGTIKGSQVSVNANSDDDTVTIARVSNGSPTVVNGFAGNDVIDASQVTKQINLAGGADDDSIIGGSGDDQIRGDSNFEFSDDGSIAFTTQSTEGNDTIAGGAGGDTIFSEGGDDTVVGGSTTEDVDDGTDFIFGGTGNDNLTGDNATISDTGEVTNLGSSGGTDYIFGDNGTLTAADGTVVSSSSDSGVVISITDDLTDATSESGSDDGDDTIAGGVGDDVLLGNNGADEISGNTGTDRIFGDNGQLIFEDGELVTAQSTATSSGGDDTLNGNEGDDIAIGGAGADSVSGNAGADIIAGDNGVIDYSIDGDTSTLDLVATTDTEVGGSDTLNGGDGADISMGGAGDDSVSGGTGNNISLGDNGQVTLTDNEITRVETTATGVGGDDSISGDTGNDIALGGAGDDTITDSAGENILLGDEGVVVGADGSDEANDVYSTNPDNGGEDTISGGSEQDIIIGGSDADSLQGNAGNDITFGDNAYVTRDQDEIVEQLESTSTDVGGNDTIEGNDGDDIAVAGAGDDTVSGNAGEDKLVGDNGIITLTDELVTSIATTTPLVSGEDNIAGGAGNDIALGGFGDDTVSGNEGEDILLGDNSVLNYAIENGSATLDEITTTEPSIGGNDSIQGNDDNDIALGGAGDDTVTGDAGEDITIGDNGIITYTSGSISTIATNNPGIGGNDSIDGGADNDIGLGGAGNDTMDGGADDDILLGDNGELDYTADDDLSTLDSVTTTNPNNGGQDQISGGIGNDTILGGTNADSINGDDGTDDPTIENSDDLIFGDFALIDISGGNSTPIDITSDAGGSDTIDGNQGDDTIFGQQGGDSLLGGSGEDDMIGGHNVIGGADGDDTMDGGDDADVMLGDNGVISRRATADGDWERYSEPFDYVIRDIERFDDIDGVGGDDSMSGGAGDDTVQGQRGDDTVNGDAGDDELYGQLGDDSLNGGTGNDTILADVGIITKDYNADGTPRVNENGSWHRDVILTDVGSLTAAFDNDTTQTDQFLIPDLFLLATVYNPDGTRKINSGGAITPIYQVTLEADGNDVIDGGAGEDAIFGQRGDDTIEGGAGDDYIEGNTGDDTITDTAGDDLIIGDDNNSLATFDTEIPVVERGIHFIGQSDELDFNLDIYGNVVIPNLTMEPKAVSSLYPTITVSPILERDNSPSPIVGSLRDNDGNEFKVEATVIPDIVNHLHLLPGNDQINAGAGEDTVIGDNSSNFEPLRTGDSTTDTSLDLITSSLYQLNYDLHHLGLALNSDTATQELIIGGDIIDAGDDEDLVMADNAVFMGPLTIKSPTNSTEITTSITDLQSVISNFSDKVNNFLTPFTDGVTTQNTTLAIGNDSVSGGDDDDKLFADDSFVITPTVLSTTYERDDFWNYDFVDEDKSGRANFREYDLKLGNDTVDGGDGADLIQGDYSNIVTSLVSETASENTEREVLQRNLELQLQDIKAFLRDLHQARYGIDYTQNDQSHSLIALNDTLNGEGDDDVIVGENATIYLPIVEGEVDTDFDFNQEFLNTDDEAYNFNQALIHQHNFIYRRDNLGLTRMGEDNISGGDGNDILFGLRGIDQVLGNDGDDYVFGGAETDTLDGGSGTNVVRTTNPSPSDLRAIALPINSVLSNLLTPYLQQYLTEIELGKDDEVNGNLKVKFPN
ncbi:MAG: hypothetical protein AAF757_01595 [Cyanobacteria bacterium P01_D01_bin.116]